jgi:RimJ/RimL family protein N-acetyltransferase
MPRAGVSPPTRPLSDGVVVLLPVGEPDLPTVERASRDAEIAERFGLTARTAREYVDGYLHAASEGTAVALAIAADGARVGQVLVEAREAGRADVGYWLLPEARGRGLAARALRLLSEWALKQPGIARVQLWTTPANVVSARVAERAGFRREGVLRSYGERADGTRVDAVFFSLLPSDLGADTRPASRSSDPCPPIRAQTPRALVTNDQGRGQENRCARFQTHISSPRKKASDSKRTPG